MRCLAAWLLLLAACGAPGEGQGTRSVEREALYRAWTRGTEEFRAEAVRLEGDEELARLWAEDLVVVMVASYHADGVVAIGEEHGRFERSRRELGAMGAVAVEPLVEMVLVGNDVGAKLSSDLLVEGGQRSAAPLLARALGGAPQRSRLRALTALAGLAFAGPGEGDVMDRLVAVLGQDPEWICRAQAAKSLVARADASGELLRVRGALARGLGDPDPGVQDACCLGLEELGDSRAVPALINHLERLVRRGAGLDHLRKAQASLRSLTRTRRDLVPAAWRQLWITRGESKGG